MAIDFKVNETKLIDELDILLHTKSNVVLSKISSSQQFQDLIKKEFNILFFLIRKNKSSNELPNKLLKEFNDLSKLDFKIDETYEQNDGYQLVDDINYLSIYIKNIFKVDINDLSKLDVKVEDNQQNNYQQSANTNSNFNSQAAFAAGTFNNQNPFLQASAKMRLQSEIRSGKVYVFKDKPKIMITLKWILIAIFALFTIALILSGVFVFLCNNFKNGKQYNNGTDVMINTIFSGIIYVLMAITFIYYDYRIYLDAFDKKKANDNLKYRFDYNSMYFLIAIFIFIYIFDLFSNTASGNAWFFSSINTFVDKNPNIVTPLWGWYCSEIICVVLFICLIIAIIVAKVYSPKPDIDKINALLKQYTDELVKSAGV